MTKRYNDLPESCADTNRSWIPRFLTGAGVFLLCISVIGYLYAKNSDITQKQIDSKVEKVLYESEMKGVKKNIEEIRADVKELLNRTPKRK